ncbi:MAG: DUF427 domain-containing protein [bacterium]
MAKAIWKGQVLAESDQCEIVEGNHYFPPDTVKKEFFTESKTHTICPWRGEASYFHLEVEGEINVDAAWTYPNPTEAAQNIKDYVAFWRGVEIQE